MEKNTIITKDTNIVLKLSNGTSYSVNMTNPSDRKIIGQNGLDNCHQVVSDTSKMLGFEGIPEEPLKEKLLA